MISTDLFVCMNRTFFHSSFLHRPLLLSVQMVSLMILHVCDYLAFIFVNVYIPLSLSPLAYLDAPLLFSFSRHKHNLKAHGIRHYSP